MMFRMQNRVDNFPNVFVAVELDHQIKENQSINQPNQFHKSRDILRCAKASKQDCKFIEYTKGV